MKRFLLVALMIGLVILSAGCASNEEAAAYAEMLDQFPGEWERVSAHNLGTPALFKYDVNINSDQTGTIITRDTSTGEITDTVAFTWRGSGNVDNRIYIDTKGEFKGFEQYYELSDDGQHLIPEQTGDIFILVRK